MSHANTTSSSSTEDIDVLIVDDHPAIQQALKAAIEAEEDMYVAGMVRSATEAHRFTDETSPRVAVVDISLRESYGLKLVEQLVAESPEVAVIVFSMYDEHVYAKRAIAAGSSGYVMKQEPLSEVIRAIRSVTEGNIYVSADIASSLIDSMAGTGSTESTSPYEKLSNREFAAFHLFGQGYTPAEIGDLVDKSRRTVRATLRRVQKKLDLTSTSDLITVATHWFHHESTEKRGSANGQPSEVER